ncbi:type II secretion system protein [Sulfurovum sp.]|uniref:type II secretion system protein n=1 Tax=Sulfurovum sp. TaxID=1969726 RepID=UPI003563D828
MVRSRSLSNRLRCFVRSGFTMIELIFAIVVIAVVMLTIPMMIGVNNKSLEGSAAQEAIFLVSAVLSETTTWVWDDNSIVGNDGGYSISKILDVGAIGSTYGRTDVNSSIRVGGLNEDLHRGFFDYNLSNTTQHAPALANGLTETLPHDIANSVAGIGGYKSSYTITATRQYVSDTLASPFVFNANTAPGNQSNLKMTEVQITATVDGVNQVIAKLRAYTCNIGEIDYAKRRF